MGMVKRNGIAVADTERRNRRAALGTLDGILTDAFQIGFGIELTADGALDGNEEVAYKAAVDGLVITRSGDLGCDFDRADLDDNGVTDFGTFDKDRLVNFVADADAGADHRTPAAGCRVGDDSAAVLYGTKHIDLRAENTVGVFVYDNRSFGFRHDHALLLYLIINIICLFTALVYRADGGSVNGARIWICKKTCIDSKSAATQVCR